MRTMRGKGEKVRGQRERQRDGESVEQVAQENGRAEGVEWRRMKGSGRSRVRIVGWGDFSLVDDDSPDLSQAGTSHLPPLDPRASEGAEPSLFHFYLSPDSN